MARRTININTYSDPNGGLTVEKQDNTDMTEGVAASDNVEVETQKAITATKARSALIDKYPADKMIDTAFSYQIDGFKIATGNEAICLICGQKTAFENRHVCPACWGKNKFEILNELKTITQDKTIKL